MQEVTKTKKKQVDERKEGTYKYNYPTGYIFISLYDRIFFITKL